MSRLDAGGRWLRSEGLRLAEVAALCAIAVVQPVLGPLGESPETFVALQVPSAQIVAFGALIALGPPLVLTVAGAAVGLFGPRWRHRAHLATVGVLAALAAVVISRELGAPAVLRVAAALGAGVGLVLAHQAWEPVRTFLRFASPAPVVLLVVFLFLSPVATLLELRGEPDLAAEATPDGDGTYPPVVVLVFDELPTLSLVDGEGGIDAELFPNLARLADTSTWYRDATTISESTPVAVASLLTGILPEEDPGWAATPEGHPDNLFSLLAQTHHLHAHEWITSICPAGSCREPTPPAVPAAEAEGLLVGGLPHGRRALATLLDEAGDLWRGSVWPLADRGAVEHILPGVDNPHGLAGPGTDFLASMTQPVGGGPVLDYFHAPVPHQPWLLLPSGRHYDAPRPVWGVDTERLRDEESAPAWVDGDDGQDLVDAARVRHVLQVQWTDRLLGAFMDRLEALGRWDDAVVVVTSDHGFGFEPGDELRVLRPANQIDIAWVPLFIKAPGQRDGEVVDDNALLIDVVPTIAELVGVEVPWALDGHSLLHGPVRERGDKPMLTEDRTGFADLGPGDIVHLDADGLGRLREDPGVGRGAGPLRPWRHGRHGGLVGEEVDSVGVCEAAEDASGHLDLPEDWTELVSTREASGGWLPLWVQGSIELPWERDVAAVVDGVVAGWTRSRVTLAGNEVGILLAEPLVLDAEEPPQLYEIVEGDDCALVELSRAAS